MEKYLSTCRLLLLAALPVALAALWFRPPACSSAEGEDLARLRINSSRFVFLQVCSQCHEPERAYLVISDPAEWATTVRRMMSREGGHVTLEEVGQFVKLMKYGDEYPRYQRALFQARCSRCHDRNLMRDLNGNLTSWHDRNAAIPERTFSWITSEEYELILLGLRMAGNI